MRPLTIGASVLFLSACAAQSLRGQAPLSPTFAAASVKTNTSGETIGRAGLQRGGAYAATNVTLRELIATAYARSGGDNREIFGGPPWIDTSRFDVTAMSEREQILDADGFYHAVPKAPGEASFNSQLDFEGSIK